MHSLALTYRYHYVHAHEFSSGVQAQSILVFKTEINTCRQEMVDYTKIESISVHSKNCGVMFTLT